MKDKPENFEKSLNSNRFTLKSNRRKGKAATPEGDFESLRPDQSNFFPFNKFD